MTTIPGDVTIHPRVIDFGPGQRRWGHDYVIDSIHDGGRELRASGWGERPAAGDYLILDNAGRGTRYLVRSVRYYVEPADMWVAELLFAPREAVPEKEPRR